MIHFRIILKKRLVFYLALFFSLTALAQDDYFQQRLAYKLQVKLNDSAHSISAFEELVYVNNSPHTLSYIYFHLWPNAYKNNSTALGKQLLWQGKTDLYYSKPEERGYIDSLDFKVNGQAVQWAYDAENIDICKLQLNQGLKPGDSIVISTPFFVKIPDAKFSRIGHTGQAYYMTQWFPKPAVFDRHGWHPMPYLDQGEFYSEFGSFDVQLTLPENYYVAATGDRVDSDIDIQFMQKRVEETRRCMMDSSFSHKNDFPPSSKNLKTLRFRQIWVHDFAWFADKRFYVLQGSVELPGNRRTVSSWAFFTPANAQLWQKALDYVESSTVFYSQMLGDYPYKHVSVVDGSIMAGGGMEYPNVTVIGNVSSAVELDMTIAHEIGHNWLYGILASNERDQPFMDEGLNSYYEQRYLREKYPRKKFGSFLGLDTNFRLFGLNRLPLWRMHELTFYGVYRSAKDQPINLKSVEFTSDNYGNVLYSKSALVFDYLADAMGREAFDAAMQEYYRTHRFSHPEPSDLFKVLSKYAGKDLAEFQQYLFESTARIDYKLKRAKRNDDGSYTLKLKNKTGVPLPLSVYAYKRGRPVGLVWFDGFKKNRTVSFPPAEVDFFKIDGLDRMPDINRANNGIKMKGLFKHARPIKLNLGTALEDPLKANLNVMPLMGGNVYNGYMLGMAFHNYSIYQKKFEYLVAPMYAFNTRTPVGFGEFNVNVYPKKVFRQITFGVKAKSFSYDAYQTDRVNALFGTSHDDLYLNFYRVSPYLEFALRKRKETSHMNQVITYQSNQLFTDSLNFTSLANSAIQAPGAVSRYSFLNQLDYMLSNSRTIDPYSLHLQLQHTATMFKTSVTLHYRISVKKNNAFELRLFAGTFLAGNANERGYYAFRTSGYNGWHDYAFDYYFMARNEREGMGFSQFVERDGAMKVWTPLGQTPEWLIAFNIKSPRFFKLPLRLFADVAACDGRALLNDKVLWDAGLNLTIVKDIVDVYLPLFYSRDIQNTLDLNKVDVLHRIRFTLNIHKLAPKKIIQNALF